MKHSCRTWNVALLCAVSFIGLSVVSCDLFVDMGVEDPADVGDANWPADQVQFDVEWDSATTVIDEDHTHLIKSSDQVKATYTFDSAGVAAAGLDISAGRILAIYGEGLAKVTAVTDDGQDLVADVEAAEITDAIKNGTIAWDLGMSWNPQTVLALDMPANLPARAMTPRYSPASKFINDDGTVDWEVTINPFKYAIKTKLLDTSAEFEITMTKEVSKEIKAKYITQGTLKRFRFKDRIEIKDGVIQEYSHSYERLRGELTLTLVVTGSGTDLNYTPPAVPIIKMPFLVGYIPGSLDVGAQFVVNASVPLDATAQASAKFSYDSNYGLEFDGVEQKASATVAGNSISSEGDQPYAAGASQMAVSFGIGFPHIELSIGHKWLAQASGWFHPAYLIGGSWTANNTNIPVCMIIESQMLIAVGAKAGVANDFLTIEGKKTLYSLKKELRRSGNCPAPAQ